MRIISVEWKNFVSYGNKLQKIDFSEKDGMFYLVMGDNGAGKSTLSDIIKFGVYGKLGNKRLRDIPNRFNQQTYVKVILLAGGSTITIERGISPNYLKLWIDGEEYDQAGKKDVEEYIVDEIIGLPFYVFNNIISLSINDFKSFLNMSPHDKRMIVDKIFSLEVINSVRWLVKDEIKKLRDLSISFSKQLETIENAIKNSEAELQKLKSILESNNQNKIATITEEINKYHIQLSDIKTQIDKIDIKIQQGNEKISNLREVLTKNKTSEQSINEKKTLYENQKCPLCESDLTTEYHKSIFEEILDTEVKVKENITKLEETICGVNDIKTKLQSARISYNKKQIEFSTHIANFKQELEKLQNEKDVSLETKSIGKIIEDSKQSRKQLLLQNDKSSNKANFFKLIEEIFGDNGVKQLAINKIMPALNAEIRQVLAELRMDYKVIFNRNFDAEITHLGHEVAIPQLSTGEKKKVDFAVLVAIIRLMKLKYPSINVIFLDEVFASIDGDGIHHILKILSDITKTLTINIFVVNHAPLPAEVFDYRISVTKPNNFSTINIEKIDW